MVISFCFVKFLNGTFVTFVLQIVSKMIRLEHYDEVQVQSTLVIISDKKTKLDKNLGEDIVLFHKKFQ